MGKPIKWTSLKRRILPGNADENAVLGLFNTIRV